MKISSIKEQIKITPIEKKETRQANNNSKVSFCANYNSNPVNPLSYQAMYGIFPKNAIYISGKNTDGSDFSMELDPKFAKKYLLDSDGKVKKDVFESFVIIYNKLANELYKTYEDESNIAKNHKLKM